MQESRVIFVTKGVLANIFATGYADEIFAAQPYGCAILNNTPFPVLWETTPDGESMIDCQKMGSDLLEKGMLHIYPFQKEQHFNLCVLLGRHFREELADLFTLANVHQAAVALDDPVIRKRVAHLLPGISLQSTLAMLHNWYIATGSSDNKTLEALQRITQLAHFLPPYDDPLLPWWKHIFANNDR